MILTVVLVSVAGAEIQLGPAVGAVEKAGGHAGSSCFVGLRLFFRGFLTRSHCPFSMMAGWLSSKTR